MRYLVMAVPERRHWVRELEQQIPQLEVVEDYSRDATDTFLFMLLQTGDGPAVHLEDDALLTSDFMAKAEAAIEEHSTEVINFFSRSKDDFAIGSRWCSGGSFARTVCWYTPKGYARAILDYFHHWPLRNSATIQKRESAPYDYLVRDWLKLRRLRFWQHVPSLVQHRGGVSIIDPKRRKEARQSMTFVP